MDKYNSKNKIYRVIKRNDLYLKFIILVLFYIFDRNYFIYLNYYIKIKHGKVFTKIKILKAKHNKYKNDFSSK